ncbi:MAG TPA: glycosyltransferase family 2 protein [Acetobacteraceae bacterium]|nr:glycosyltransferase family 2 protein [Acetobacteraceae bacterium]
MAGTPLQPIDHGSRAALRVAVVIPAYDEAATIADLICRCRMLAEVSQVIVVDDCSRDATARLAIEAGAQVLRHDTNQGKGASLRDGMRAALAAGADHIATLDGDGQHRPEDLSRLLACCRDWPGQIVIGSRRAASATAPRARVIANRVADFWVSWAARHPIDDSQSGFRIYPAEVARRVALRPDLATGFAFESEVLIEAGRVGVRTVAVDIPAIYGAALRASHFRPVTDITRIVRMVAGKLLRTWMDPIGLWRSLTGPRLR